MRRFLSLVLATVLCISSASVLRAQNWEALVIGNPGPGAESANADAAAVSQGLIASGIVKTTLLRGTTLAEVDAALTSFYGLPNVILYIAAPFHDGSVTLADSETDMPAILGRLARGGTTHVGLLYENCSQNTSTAMPVPEPTAPDGMTLLFSLSTPSGQPCPKSGERLTDALSPRGSGESLQSRIGTNRVTASGKFPKIPMNRTGAVTVTPEIPVVTDDTVSLVPAVKMINLGLPTQTATSQNHPIQAAITPVSLTPASDPLPTTEVVAFSVPNEDQIVAAPLNQGLPRPYLILGTITPENADAFGPIEQTIDLARVDFGYDDLQERRAFREKDPEMFQKLVAGGALDPRPNQLSVALQTELKRMGCYTGGIDGDWGPGSQASAKRYFDSAKTERVASNEPTAKLFRMILLKDDVTCPKPVAATQTRRPNQTASAASRNTAAARPAQPQRQQPARQQQPAPAAAPVQQIQPGATLGVFR